MAMFAWHRRWLSAEYDHVAARFLYYTPDQINSTRVVTDQSRNVVYPAT
jgi:hypothetical protein